MDNVNKPASELTKLEYALIHSTWEPPKEDVVTVMQREKIANPYNDSYKPRLRSASEITKDLKIKYFTNLLTN